MKPLLLILLNVLTLLTAKSQTLSSLITNQNEVLVIEGIVMKETEVRFPSPLPLFTFEVNDTLFQSLNLVWSDGNSFITPDGRLSLNMTQGERMHGSFNYFVVFHNSSNDTLSFSNVVPLGALPANTYITATGPWSLTRAKLFRPGLVPVSVILPDNAWESGYGSANLQENLSLAAMARRVATMGGSLRRYRTVMPPASTVTYRIFFESYQGAWQNGLLSIFRDHYLYDLDTFDNTLFNRNDLSWIRHKYMLSCTYAWDHQFYDRNVNAYQYENYLDIGRKYFGGFDAFILWPTWPILGLDQRNQWDLYYDLPGGISKIRQLSQYSQQRGTAFFISYNPWDMSTQQQDHLNGMTRLISETDASGVILDTQGWSSRELQEAADRAKQGVVMYSEGMAVVKDMPGIVSGRVHDAIFLSPVLNLNKLIKPDFAIFRVLQLSQGRIKREVDLSFFNGYGFELNTFAPGRPDWMPEEFKYMGKLLKILRENAHAFTGTDLTPLIPTIRDSVYVNIWKSGEKELFTIYSLIPEGINESLFEVDVTTDERLVDLWNHEYVEIQLVDGKSLAVVSVSSFDKAWLGTRREGNVGCVVSFRKVLSSDLLNGVLRFEATKGDSMLVWAGNPSYQNSHLVFNPGRHQLHIRNHFPGHEGKIVLQLFHQGQLIDEVIKNYQPGTPVLISEIRPTSIARKAPLNMVEIAGGAYLFTTTHGDKFISYPQPAGYTTNIRRFFIDTYPVTNEQFREFLINSGYKPADTNRFLKDWINEKPVAGREKHPVVHVSYEDASAFCAWAGKRLPAEVEWQYAGQGNDTISYPWGSAFDALKCNNALGSTTPVDQYPRGKSRFGVQDMVGNVWQLTNDVYDNGAYQFVIIKGGSYFKPTSSWWYVQGGPQPLHYRQMLLQVSEGFERNATVGFRCVKDAE